MSTVKTSQLQMGISNTSSENFHWKNNLDGTLTLFRGNVEDVSPVAIASVGADNVIAGKNQATAWVNFNGTGTVAIRDSFNISSITDNGTGDYIVNFLTPMANTNYTVNITPKATAGASVTGCLAQAGVESVNSFRVVTLGVNGASTDASMVSIVVFGGK